MSRSRSLRIKSEQAGDVTVLQVRRKNCARGPLQVLKDAVSSLPRMRVIVLDLSGIDMLDCGGLGILVFLQGWSRNNGIQLKLVDPSNLLGKCFSEQG